MAFGVTPTGFVKKTLPVIKAEMESDERSTIDEALNLASTSVFGQINGIFADKLREMWDVAEAVYRSLQPDSAEGDAQDAICALNNVRRLPPTFSTVTCVCVGVPATPLPAGRVISIGANGARFSTLSDATISTDGTVEVDCESELSGPVQAPAGTLTTIVTPVSGWVSVTNALDAAPGTDIETDSAMRARRLIALTSTGDTTDAILAVVKAVSGVTNALIFENTDMVADASGVPAKSFETIVEGGSGPDIAQAIFSKKPAGVQAYGSFTLDIADSQGTNHTIGYSRPDEINIYVELMVSVKLAQFGSGNSDAGILLVQEAIVALGDSLSIGQLVVALKVEAAALNVVGVVDVTNFLIGVTDPPVLNSNIPITNRQLAVFDTSRIVVTVIPA